MKGFSVTNSILQPDIHSAKLPFSEDTSVVTVLPYSQGRWNLNMIREDLCGSL